MRALNDTTAAQLRADRLAGMTYQELAIRYHCHYKTAENYCKGLTARMPESVRVWTRNRFMRVR
jgi:hypothetical protein